jgi:hypothetical protein
MAAFPVSPRASFTFSILLAHKSGSEARGVGAFEYSAAVGDCSLARINAQTAAATTAITTINRRTFRTFRFIMQTIGSR